MSDYPLPKTDIGRRLLASRPLIGTWTVESLADMICGIEAEACTPAAPEGTDEPSCCELACYEDEGCSCDGCGGSLPAHVTPVGCWLLAAGLILAVIVALVLIVERR